MKERFYKMFRNGEEFGSCSNFNVTCSSILFDIQMHFPPTEGWIDKNGDALNFAYGYVNEVHFYRVIDGHTETGSMKDYGLREKDVPFYTICTPALALLTVFLMKVVFSCI